MIGTVGNGKHKLDCEAILLFYTVMSLHRNRFRWVKGLALSGFVSWKTKCMRKKSRHDLSIFGQIERQKIYFSLYFSSRNNRSLLVLIQKKISFSGSKSRRFVRPKFSVCATLCQTTLIGKEDRSLGTTLFSVVLSEFDALWALAISITYASPFFFFISQYN